MALKSFGTKPVPPAVDAAVAPVAPAPKRDDRVQKSVRLTKAQWRRVRQLEYDTERTFQQLAVEGLSRLLAEHGLEAL